MRELEILASTLSANAYMFDYLILVLYKIQVAL